MLNIYFSTNYHKRFGLQGKPHTYSTNNFAWCGIRHENEKRGPNHTLLPVIPVTDFIDKRSNSFIVTLFSSKILYFPSSKLLDTPLKTYLSKYLDSFREVMSGSNCQVRQTSVIQSFIRAFCGINFIAENSVITITQRHQSAVPPHLFMTAIIRIVSFRYDHAKMEYIGKKFNKFVLQN